MRLSNRVRSPIVQSNRATINIDELEETLKSELFSIGFEQAVFVILDPKQNYAYEYSLGFEEHQLETYSVHQKHDVYLSQYLYDQAFGQIVYLQDLVPDKQIKNEIFWDVLVPTMKIRHSMCGVQPLLNNYSLILSSHSYQKPSVKQQLEIDNLWCYLTHWANNWIAKLDMQRCKQSLLSQKIATNQNVKLTSTELEVLGHLVEGLDGSEIAFRRRVSKETVRSQIKQLLHKTQSKHQNHLISRYYREEFGIGR
ncbi:helix-turn-helix transcriptional regulator [Vibrio algarum]|uniref:LuxR C-terminal-related transcriptional regulator n=1 Tax=Vibrio algarum TaxID=3020714 RepID=A0ABT4YQT3_9VIBR|nr:LuxR C-terminal-related transcriptional regulator [Vibrio sp. KJ40-1]MDB1123389.1 LuxR C-terminal-related transcriptional regulator [Vibrio sp. KJ40-1]